MTPDLINGLFEFFGGLFLFLNVKRLHKDKKLSGVSFVPTAFFTVWGYWNLYFYPTVGAMWSFYGGILVMVMNTTWIVMALYYRKGSR